MFHDCPWRNNRNWIVSDSGDVIHTAGPFGALTAYVLIGAMVYFLMTSLGEMALIYPLLVLFQTMEHVMLTQLLVLL